MAITSAEAVVRHAPFITLTPCRSFSFSQRHRPS